MTEHGTLCISSNPSPFWDMGVFYLSQALLYMYRKFLNVKEGEQECDGRRTRM
jgi:hypothetical protein